MKASDRESGGAEVRPAVFTDGNLVEEIAVVLEGRHRREAKLRVAGPDGDARLKGVRQVYDLPGEVGLLGDHRRTGDRCQRDQRRQR